MALYRQPTPRFQLLLSGILLLILSQFRGSDIVFPVVKGNKYNQRVFENVAAINFAESERNGFRVILSDSFISRHLRPGSLPTIFVTAIPLRPNEHERYTHVFYPEKRRDDKLLVRVHNLRARSWYYVCIEWENINRHNDTTGTSCRLYRTLDKFGKTASTTVTDVQVREMRDNLARFRVRYDANFPVRLTAYLKGGQAKIAAQTFLLNQPSWADVTFPFLQSATNYGQLCVLEEPLVRAYSAMGRLISGLTREKCYFDDLTTKSLNSLNGAMMATEPQRGAGAAYKRVMKNKSTVVVAAPLNYFHYSLLFLLVRPKLRKSKIRNRVRNGQPEWLADEKLKSDTTKKNKQDAK